MAMLAEPRRKQKVINLRAKNNAWSNDNTKFGQRMLEKMGWSSGKGLGIHENGITEHVVARYKNDEKGLGFEDKNDQWTKHEDDFNALLANLSNASDNNENLHSRVSLEDKSKKSKTRIHYHKFTRGKDISRYSEKDLANIFGKRSFKNTEAVEEPLKEDLKTTEQVFTEKGSMADYFKNKLAAFQSKMNVVSDIKESEGDEPNYTFHGFAQNTDDTEVSTNACTYSTEVNMVSQGSFTVVNPVCNTKESKKKNKKSKHKDLMNVYSNNAPDNQENVENNIECYKKKKMKKKKVAGDDMSDICNKKNSMLDFVRDVDCVDGLKKNKKRKNKDRDLDGCNLESACINTSTICETNELGPVQTNKKKKKSKNKEKIESNTISNIGLEEIEVPKKKKKKKNKED